MGGKICKKNILLVGPASSGKTSLLYHLKLRQFIPDFNSTDAFNYEVIMRPKDGFRYDLHTWDLSGKEELNDLWKVLYENANIDVITYVINANITDHLADDVKKIHYLMHESSLRIAKFVILLNVFNEADPGRLTEDYVSKQLIYDEITKAEVPPNRLHVIEINTRSGDGLERYINEVCTLQYGIEIPPQRV